MSPAGVWLRLQHCTNPIVALDLIEEAVERGATQLEAKEALALWEQMRREDCIEIGEARDCND